MASTFCFSGVMFCVLLAQFISKGEKLDVPENPQDSTDIFDKDLIFWALKKRRSIIHKTYAYYSEPTKDNTESQHMQKTVLFESVWNGEIWTIASDYHARRLYYTDHVGNFIGVYDLKTKEMKKVFQGMAWGIDSLSVDWVSGNVYWADSHFDAIMVANRNFTYYRKIIDMNTGIPAKVAVHPEERYLYWTEKQKEDCRIYRSDLRGYRRELLHTFTDVQTITDVSIDFTNSRFYWAEKMKINGGVSRIRYFDMDNTEAVYDVYATNSSYFFGLASYKNYLYIMDDLQKRMITLEKDTGKIVDDYRFTYYDIPRGVTTFSLSEQPWSPNDRDHKCASKPCQHLCIATFGLNNYACECKIGFKIQTDGRRCISDVVRDNFALLLDSRHSKIYQLNMNNPIHPQEIPINEIESPSSAVFEPRTNTMYWADQKLKKISRTSLLGLGQKTLISDVHVYSIALDTGAGNLYWIDAEKDALYVSKMDGSHKRMLLINDFQRVYTMTIDTRRGFLYWSDWGQVSINGTHLGQIESSRLDGSERRVVFQAGVTPHGLTLDVERNILYWTHLRTQEIRWFDLNSGANGNYKMAVKKAIRPLPVSIAYHDDYLYVADMTHRHLLRIHTNDVMNNVVTGNERMRNFGEGIFYQLTGVSIYSKETYLPGSAVCSESMCPQLCLPVHSSNTTAVTYRCECQDHFQYVAENNSCVQISALDDDIPPTFEDTCPEERIQVFADECSDFAVVDFPVPKPVDNSGKPVVLRSSVEGLPPYNLGDGITTFSYKATDTNGNSAFCQFDVEVEVRMCYESDLDDMPEGAVLGPKSCGSKVGSVINVTCPGRSEPSYQYECKPNLDWEPIGTPSCEITSEPIAIPPKSNVPGTTRTPSRNPTSTAKDEFITAESSLRLSETTDDLPKYLERTGPSTTSLVVGLVIGILVLIIIVLVAIFAYRRRKGQPFIPGSKWKRVEDRVHLTGASTESGIYLGEQQDGNNHTSTLPESDKFVL